MSLSTLKHIIYSSLIVSETDTTDNVNEAKLNIMQVTFISLQSKPENVDEAKMGQEVFRSLFNEYHKKVANAFHY